MNQYIFKSDRLGFRNWKESDKLQMGIINSDCEVMEYFPSVLTQKQTDEFIDRMRTQFAKNGFCYFAVDQLENNELIGFIGINEQNFKSDFTPCVDIGWRLSKKQWGKGFATEGAKKCLEFAFNEIGLKSIKAICPEINNQSEKVMHKIGMKKIKQFNHPLLSNYKRLEKCVLYEINSSM